MLQAWRVSSRTDPDLSSSVRELLQSTSRDLFLITGGIYLCWHLVSTIIWPERLGSAVWLITPIVTLTFILALWALPRHFVAAQFAWQFGLAIAITLAVHLFQRPEIGFLYAILPLISVVTTPDWCASFLIGALVGVLAWWLSHGLIRGPVPVAYSLAVIAGGLITWLLGWASTHALLTVTQWSLSSFELARKRADMVMEQQSELKQAQQDLVLANDELARLSDRLKAMYRIAEEARQAKEQFVANVSHELRTPLNMIIGFSEMITESPEIYSTDLPSSLLTDIAAIMRNSQHLAKLVNDVLDLSQVEAGQMALSKEWVSMQEIADEAAQTVQALYETKGLYLQVESPSEPLSVFCDSTRIRQVIINLLSNAGRFTDRGGVRVRFWQENHSVVVCVIDSGPGIAPENRKKVFEPFQQADTSIRRRHGGSGLGLSISKQFVEMHGGEMWIESPSTELCASLPSHARGPAEEHWAGRTGERGAGTTIFFRLPLDLPSPELVDLDRVTRWLNPYDEYEYRARTRRSKVPAPRVYPRFVVIEEGNSLCRILERYLDSVELVLVRSITDAIRDLNHVPARALLVNAPPSAEQPILPHHLQQIPYKTPVITCWVPGEAEEIKHLGVTHYLVKPVTGKTLLSTLDEVGKDIKTVLLVDDSTEVLQLFARMLSSARPEYRILQATTGQRALSLMRERQPDVVLLDLMMPNIDGFQVLQQKAQDPSIGDIPVVVVSSRDPSEVPIARNTLSVTKGDGLTVYELLTCIQQISETLMLPMRPDPAHSEKPAA
jgi:signal transduction histidine kinase/CheY-like chemotaxis protein